MYEYLFVGLSQGVGEIFTGIRTSGQLINPGNRVVFNSSSSVDNTRVVDLEQRQAFTLPVSGGTAHTSSRRRWLAITTSDEITVWDAASGDLALTITVEDVQELGITRFSSRAGYELWVMSWKKRDAMIMTKAMR